MKRDGILNIGDSDEKADWIKTGKNRKSEAKIHSRIAKELEKPPRERRK